jgi:hypothetical protein
LISFKTEGPLIITTVVVVVVVVVVIIANVVTDLTLAGHWTECVTDFVAKVFLRFALPIQRLGTNHGPGVSIAKDNIKTLGCI